MAKHEALSDQELVQLMRTSDHAAYTEIYRRYSHLIFVFALRKLSDEDMAKDVIQELFTNLWVRREVEFNATNLAGYLYTSARNRILDIFAHQQVESKYISSLKDFASVGYEHTDHLVREKQFSDYIDQQIQALPAKMREVFELSRKENLSYQEIAIRLDTTENNVSKHVVSAIRVLRTKLHMIIPILF